MFHDLENGRARAFVDLLARRDIEGTGPGAPLAREVHRIDRQIQRGRVLHAASGATGPVPDEHGLLVERKRQIALLRRLDADLAQTVAVQVPPLPRIRHRLSRGEALAYVMPSDGPRSAYRLLLVDAHGARLVDTGVDSVALRRVLRTLSSERASHGAQTRRVEQLSTQLALQRWAPRARLYLVPSGDFHLMPWGALDLPEGLEIVVLPTGSWLTRRPPSGDFETRAVVVGAPEFGEQFPPLPGARSEARLIARQYGVDAILGTEATLAEVRARVGTGSQVLHLATHGAFDARAPLHSAVVLSDGRQARSVTALDLFEQPLHSRLVVLSACESGLAQGEAGDDYLGLARSFYLGGAVSVLNSLWPVADEPTARFMQVFHEHARRGEFARGWRAARDRLRDEGLPPSSYGAFVLGGSAARS
ncbi:MAG: CHAT domain-containing protein [Gammaproteobacteria bacterium]|nr:CHAT domain-containing protein [Gammaproteobacteria bacterium]